MKAHLRQAAILAALVAIGLVTTAAVLPPISIHPESRVWVEGGSSVRSYKCEAAEVRGTVDAGAEALDPAHLEGAVRRVDLAVAVAGLECGNGTMNGHMRKALKAAEHATIEFQLANYAVVAAGSGESSVKMDGTLKIAGQARPIVVEGVATSADNGALRVRGSKEIVMSEFGVKPPSLMMGTMKVHDKVKINFDIVLRP